MMMAEGAPSPASSERSSQGGREKEPPPTLEELKQFRYSWMRLDDRSKQKKKVDELRRYFRALCVYYVHPEYDQMVVEQCRNLWQRCNKPADFPDSLWRNPNSATLQQKEKLVDKVWPLKKEESHSASRPKKKELLDAVNRMVECCNMSRSDHVSERPINIKVGISTSDEVKALFIAALKKIEDDTPQAGSEQKMEQQQIEADDSGFGSLPPSIVADTLGLDKDYGASMSAEVNSGTISTGAGSGFARDTASTMTSGTAAPAYQRPTDEHVLDLVPASTAQLPVISQPQPPQQSTLDLSHRNLTVGCGPEPGNQYVTVAAPMAAPAPAQHAPAPGNTPPEDFFLKPCSLERNDPKQFQEFMRLISSEAMDTRSPPPSPGNQEIPTMVWDETADADDWTWDETADADDWTWDETADADD